MVVSSLVSLGARPRALLVAFRLVGCYLEGRAGGTNVHESLPYVLPCNHAFLLLCEVWVCRGEEVEGFFDFGFLVAAEIVLFGEFGRSFLRRGGGGGGRGSWRAAPFGRLSWGLAGCWNGFGRGWAYLPWRWLG